MIELKPDEAHFADQDEPSKPPPSMAGWFYDQGFGVFPVGLDKKPACASWDDFTCPHALVTRFRNYGVQLGPLRRPAQHADQLICVDTDNAETEAWVAANLLETPFTVKTGRGMHRYYRLRTACQVIPKHIHRVGLSIEFKGKGQYVVGPGSVHGETGTIYTAADWSWEFRHIPLFPIGEFLFDDRDGVYSSLRHQGLKVPTSISAGERHNLMFLIARSLVSHGVPLEGVVATCQAENLAKCDPPLDASELDRYVRRAFHQPDRKDFLRTPKTGWDLAGSLIDVGLSVDAALVAVRSITPHFDPEVGA